MKTNITTNALISLFFLIYMICGAYIAYVLQVFHNDTVARAALGFFTAFGREPHMSALGFVWQPLPSILQIPLLAILRPIQDVIMPSIIISSLSGALAVGLVYKIATFHKRTKNTRIPLLLAILFGLNPVILLHAVIGTTEMLFIACLLAASYNFIKWFYTQSQASLLLASIFTALSFWSRYESIPAFIGFIALIVLYMLVMKKDLRKTESLTLQFALPFCYSVLFWIFANWMIMKDPFYFLHSPYSNASLTETLKGAPGLLENTYNSIGNSLLYAAKRIALLSPILVAAPFFLLSLRKKWVKINDVVLLLFMLTPYAFILLFHTQQLYKGQSLGWLRFFMYAIIMGVLLAIFITQKSKHKIFPIIAVVLLCIGTVTSGYALTTPLLGKEEHSFVRKMLNNNEQLEFSRTFADQKKVAAYMDSTSGNILVDTDDGFAIPLFSSNPKRYIIRSDTDFESIVQNYPTKTSWIIIPEPKAGVKDRNKIYQYYPDMWEKNIPHTRLVQKIDGWKIYKVIPSTTIGRTISK